MYLKKTALLLGAAICLHVSVRAQAFETPGAYMEYISKANEKITSLYLSYLSAVGHNKSARKVEKRRQEVVNTIFDTRLSIQGMPPWKGDRTYRDTTVSYLKMLYAVFNDDYGKIVNMEEIAEQSYDGMEAYMMAQEKAGERLKQAGENRKAAFKSFADKNNITILENMTALEQKSNQAGELMKHYNQVYLIFFKPFKQEAYLLDAMEHKNLTALEQNKSALEKFASDGLVKLKDLQGYNNDPSLILACTDLMNFYREEAKGMQYATDFTMQEEAWLKTKKAFESQSGGQRSQKDVDEFNKEVRNFNAAVNDYNNQNNQWNKQRGKALDHWNDSVKKYLDDYMPYQRKG